MSKKEKLFERFKTRPKDFTWDEAVQVMKSRGFRMHKHSGSARWFVHEQTKLKVRLHEPHPSPILKSYMFDVLIDGLKAAGAWGDEGI
jgi:predicted RNA binding protein YcfA (HicA-like mRNA interferase family)